MVLRRGRSPGRAAPVDRVHPGHDQEPGAPARPATIDGLAKGLEVPVSAVRAAAAESTGMHYYEESAEGSGRGAGGDQERELLIASIDELSAEDRRHVAALVESLRNRSAPQADQ